MCTTKAPKPQPVAGDEKKPVQYLSNPWVDGLGIGGTAARGRNSLRIDRGGAPARRPVLPPIEVPTTVPRIPGGGGGVFTPGLGISQGVRGGTRVSTYER